MNLNTILPAIRRGLGRSAVARSWTGNAPSLRPQPTFPLTLEETRLAIIEVLG